MAKSNDFEKMRAKIIAHAWKDPQFKERLLKNPRAAFKEMGWDLPEQFNNVRVVEDKQNAYTFVLPPTVAHAEELSDAELQRLAGAGRQTSDNCSQGCITRGYLPECDW